MFGLQVKSAKPAPRTSTTKPGSRSKAKMTTVHSESRSGASSSASEKPEKLSRVITSPYTCKLNPAVTTKNRAQSASSLRQKESFSPNVKAKDFFRKTSESQLTSKSSRNDKLQEDTDSSSKLLSRNSKHVRIDTVSGTRALKSRFTSAPTFLGSNSERITLQQDSTAQKSRKPFSFSSERSRSGSIISNDSCSNPSPQPDSNKSSGGDGDHVVQRRSDFLNKRSSFNNCNNFEITNSLHLNKRSSSVDITGMDSEFENDVDDDFFRDDDPALEMKITEIPDESLNEENHQNVVDTPEPVDKPDLNEKVDLNKTICLGSEPKSPKRTSDFDKLLLEQSDCILQDVSELIKEINASEYARKEAQTKSPKMLHKDSSVEKLVDDLKNDINRQLRNSALLLLDSSQYKNSLNEDNQLLDTSVTADSFMRGLDLSGIELSEITCPQQVMEQSVPNSSRFEMVSNTAVNIEASAESSDSNNENLSRSSARTIQQYNYNNNALSPTGLDHDTIQRSICSALKLLEEEDRKSRPAMTDASSNPGTSARSQSPCVSSNPNSLPESRGRSPRIISSTKIHQYPSQSQQDLQQNQIPGHEFAEKKGDAEFSSGYRSARSCSCLADGITDDLVNSPRSCKTASSGGGATFRPLNIDTRKVPPASSGSSEVWQGKDAKTMQIFSFLDEVEKSDQERLFGLQFESDGLGRPATTRSSAFEVDNVPTRGGKNLITNKSSGGHNEKHFRTLDVLIRKGSVELAREILLLERKLDEAQHSIKLLEESLLNQRELNIRNLRSSERDFKKRLKLQKEEFDMTFSRNEALINEMASEKRVLQEKLDKLLKTFEEIEEKHKEQTKSMQQKHLDEIRRLRKLQMNAENTLKQRLAGSKAHAQEVREMTVKGLEPEVQRIIQRHQQEMSEMRAWHADELRETEERHHRKLHMQLEDIREKFAKEKEDAILRERELASRRLEAELKQKDEEIENHKRRLTNEIFEERERAVTEEMRIKESMHETVRKAQIKTEVELENLRQEYETKMATSERRHETELDTVKDVFQAEKQNWASNQLKKLEQALSEQETKLREIFDKEKDKEWREREKKLKDEFEKFRKDDEDASEGRFRRMQDKLQAELGELEKSEKDVKSKLTQSKSDLLAREEELFSLKASVKLKDQQLTDLQDMNIKMQEERVNLTSVIRREFTDQIAAVEEDCRALKATIVELQSNAKFQVEQKQHEIGRIISEKESEIEHIGMRVKQAVARKDETILELQKQLEKCSFQISHLEELLEEQRKELLQGMKMPTAQRKK